MPYTAADKVIMRAALKAGTDPAAAVRAARAAAVAVDERGDRAAKFVGIAIAVALVALVAFLWWRARTVAVVPPPAAVDAAPEAVWTPGEGAS